MSRVSPSPTLVSTLDEMIPLRIAESALCRAGRIIELDEFHEWYRTYAGRAYTQVERVSLDDLDGWLTDPVTGDIRHESGKFFTVSGIDVEVPGGAVPHWDQPVINQPEVGILGIVVKDFGGVLHCLMQAKVEPGNCNGLQLSPTVQATRSNYMRVHRGKSVPYLEYFHDRSRSRRIVDVRQSEQGSWFLQKCNRNMVVEVTEDVDVHEGFCWLSLGQLHQLLGMDDLINMDARTVLSCLPFAGDVATVLTAKGSGFHSALVRSFSSSVGSLHTTEDILSWITERRTHADVRVRPVPLRKLRDWHRVDGGISHTSGRFFDVIGVSVTAGGREVGSWCQPMIKAHGHGVVAFLIRSIGGVLHALVQARVEPGYVDSVELAPTVQCTPDNYLHMAATARPPFLDQVLGAPAEHVRFATTLSEEGGRFYHTRNRYLIVETTVDVEVDHPSFRWMTLHQIVDLLRHSYYFNVQARSLVACMHSLFSLG